MQSPNSAVRLLAQVPRLRDLPTLSAVLSEVHGLLSDVRAPRARLAELIRKDQVLTAKVLRLVNSSYYGRGVEITDISKALHFLGDDSLRLLVLGTSSFAEDDGATGWFHAREFWQNAAGTALAAEAVARAAGIKNPEECFTCGLLQGLGKMVLHRLEPALTESVLRSAFDHEWSFLRAEQELGLPGHHVLGERLAEEWRLPLVVRKALRYSVRDISEFPRLYPELRPAIFATSLGRSMARQLEIGFSGDHDRPEYWGAYVKVLGLDAAALIRIEKEVLRGAERLCAWMSPPLPRVA